MSKPAISKHLKVLEETGVVSRQVAGRKHQLHLNPAALAETVDWIDRQRVLWERMFDVVEEYLTDGKETVMHVGTTDTAALRIERTFYASAQKVFDAWTSPEVMRRWWHAGPDWQTPVAEVDLRVGGGFTITMRDADGVDHTGRGRYTVVDPPAKLAWIWEGFEDEAGAGSLLELDIRERAGVTTVVLIHSGLRDAEASESFGEGWNLCLDNLEAVLGS